MSTVSELMAGNISNAQTNVQTWGGILYNVKAYGAKGDGLSDDSSAIQKAINEANDKAGAVFFPQGTYIIKSQLVVPSGVKRLFAYGDAMLNFQLFVDDVGIRIMSTTDFVYEGINHTQNIAHKTAVLWLDTTTRTNVQNCRWITTGGMGVSLALTNDTYIQNCYFEDTGKTSLGDFSSRPAIWVGEAPTYLNRNVNIMNCYFKDTNWSGVYMFAMGGSISYCQFDGCGESSVFSAYEASDLIISNNTIRNGNMVHIASFGLEIGDARHVNISNNTIYNMDEGGIGLGNLKDFVVANNTCHHNGKGLGANENKAGIVLRQTVADPSTTERGIIIGNHCYDEYDTGTKVQKYGLSTFKTPGAGFIREVAITNNDFLFNATSAVYLEDEQTIGGDVIFANNLGYAQQPIVKVVDYPTVSGNFSITGIGFRPRYIEISAFIVDTKSKSIAKFCGSDLNSAILIEYENATKIKNSTAFCVYLVDNADVLKTSATFVDLINDGFTINVGILTTITAKMIITCYP